LQYKADPADHRRAGTTGPLTNVFWLPQIKDANAYSHDSGKGNDLRRSISSEDRTRVRH